MRVFHEPLSFNWDEGNSNKNLENHGVSNQEAEEVFFQRDSLVFDDQRHSTLEKRRLILGRTTQGRKLSVIFTTRKEKIRVISARDMSKKERKVYEEKAKIDTEI